MALKDRIEADRTRVFLQSRHFAETHTWNGKPFLCMTDEEAALKRKNNNVNDISWDNNTMETLVYVREEDFPGHAVPNEHGYFDRVPMKILQVQNDMGMLAIVLVTNAPRSVSE